MTKKTTKNRWFGRRVSRLIARYRPVFLEMLEDRSMMAAPVITSNGGGSSANISLLTGVSTVTNVTATDPDLPAQTLTYSLSGGADQARFQINSSSGLLEFLSPPNFNQPMDAGANNVYNVTVQVSDGTGGTDTQALAITITNLLSASSPRDLIWDHVRQQLLITTASGALLRYTEATGQFSPPITVGTGLSGGDITADGAFLYVTETSTTGGGKVHKVNLATAAVTDLPYTLNSFERGGWDLNITSDNLAFFVTDQSISGTVPFRQINLATDVISTSAKGSILRKSNLTRGVDRSLLLLQEVNIDTGPISKYVPGTGFDSGDTTDTFLSSQIATVSRDGSMIALEINAGVALSAGVAIFDRNYTAIDQLNGYDGGILFHPTQPILFAVDSGANQVVAFDTNTWRERYRLNIGEDVGSSSPLGAGVMAVNSAGTTLYLSTGTGVRQLTLPAASGVASVVGLTNYSTYLSPGTQSSITVTMRDPSGTVIPDYAGTVRFTSTDAAAVLPADYTFTPADAGSHTFSLRLNTAGTFSVTAADTGNASLTSTTNSIQIHAAPSTLLPITGARDLVFDASRNVLYAMTSTGLVQRYDLTTDSLLAPFVISQGLNSGDTNLNESSLYVLDSVRNAAESMIRKVDLNTGAYTNLTYDRDRMEGAGWDLEIGSDGIAQFTGRFEGSGVAPLRLINLANDAISNSSRGSPWQDTHVTRGEDRSRLFFQQGNSTAGETFSYAPGQGYSANYWAEMVHDSLMAAVSPNGSLIALELGSTIAVFDSSFRALAQLGNVAGGMFFHPTQNILFAVDSNADQIVAFDTNTWKERYRLAIGENVDVSQPQGAGVMAASPNGSHLFLRTAAGVRVFALPAATGIAANVNIVDISSYVAAGVTTSVTIAMRDPSGAIATNYAGTVRFTSSDPAAVLPPNYTFTPADAGQHTFNFQLNTSGSRTITITDTGNASLTATSPAIAVHVGASTLLPVTGARDLIVDTLRNVVYITTSSGQVQRYQIASDSLLTPYNVSHGLYGGDINAAQSALYIQEGLQNLDEGMYRKIDLNTGAVTNLNYNIDDYEGTGWDLAIAADGKGYATSRFQGSGTSPFRSIDMATDAIARLSKGPLTQDTHIIRGVDRSRLFFLQSNTSNGPTFQFTPATGFSNNLNANMFMDDVMSAVSPDGSLRAIEINGNVAVFTSANVAVETLTGFTGGVTFHPTQPLLFVVNDSTNEVVAYETTTWRERYRLAIGENVGTSTPMGAGTMTVGPDGNQLFLVTGAGVRVLALPANTGVPATLMATGYSTYLAAGAPASVTVTIRDSAGNIAAGYTGTVRFTSTDGAAGLPANYTFTAADAGVKTFTFTLATSGSRTVTVTDTLQPALTSTTSNITVHTTATSLIPVTNARDLAFDATRNVLYISTTNGVLQRYSVASDSLLSPWTLSQGLAGIDTTPGNTALYAVDTNRNFSQSMVRKVDLNTGALSKITYDAVALEAGGWDIAIDANGMGQFTANISGGSSGFPVRLLNTATDTAIVNPKKTSAYIRTHIARNANRMNFGYIESNISSGPIGNFSVATDSYDGTNLWRSLDSAFMAINNAATVYAIANSNNNIEIFDANLDLVTTINGVRGGVAFKPGTNRLYIADYLSDTIKSYDGDNNWALVDSVPIGESITSMSNNGTGVVTFADNGNRLFLVTPTGVRIFATGDIAAPTATGTPGSQTILEDASSAPLAFTVADNVTLAANLVITASSSNTSLIPNANLVLGGSGANRTLTITPVADLNGGPVTITVKLVDEALNESQFTFTANVTPVNDPPSFVKGADQTVNNDAGPQSVPGWATAISSGPTNESAQTVSFSVAANSNTALFSAQPAVASNGTLTFTPAVGAVGTATITLRAQDSGGTANGGNDSSTQTFTITVNAPPFVVVSASLTSTGVVIAVNHDVDATQLNLYDIGAAGAADLTLVGAATGAVRGSLIVDPTLRTLTFVKSAGLLAADTYTLTLRSAANGWRDASGVLLDGDANGLHGGDYVQSLVVSPAVAVSLQIKDLVRGPQQSSVLPVSFSNGAGVTTANFQLRFDPALLSITGANVASGLPAGATVNLDQAIPGVASLQFTSPTPLPAGLIRFIDLQTSVPGAAPLWQKQVLDLANISLNGGSISASDDDAVQVVAFPGDLTGNGRHSGHDAAALLAIVNDATAGLASDRLLDATIVADLSNDQALTVADVTASLQLAVAHDVAGIPGLQPNPSALPAGSLPVKLSIAKNLTAAPGQTITIPARIETLAPQAGIVSTDLVLYYDPRVLDVTSIQLGSLLPSNTWEVASRIDALAGRIIVSLAGSVPLTGTFNGELLQLQATVKPQAPSGATRLNLATGSRTPARFTQVNESALAAEATITDAANDAVDGLLTIAATPANTESPSAALSAGHLRVQGTHHNDFVLVGVNSSNRVIVRVNATHLGTFAIPASVSVDLFSGRDFVYVDSDFPDPIIATDPNDSLFGIAADLIFAAAGRQLVNSPLPPPPGGGAPEYVAPEYIEPEQTGTESTEAAGSVPVEFPPWQVLTQRKLKSRAAFFHRQ